MWLTDQPSPAPRLCYLGSVGVEATSAGPLQLYRLLHGWRREHLRVVEAECRASEPAGRLPGVPYSTLEPCFRRGWFFARTRAPGVFWPALEAHAAWLARRAAQRLAEFRPEAILTVHERFGWFTAARLAQRLRVPLHLILHDDWFRNVPMAPSLRARFDRAFGEVYRGAASRLCVSPAMEQEYARRFGVRGTVLYPTQDAGLTGHDSPPPNLGEPGQPLHVAYAGNVFNAGYWEALRHVAAALAPTGGRLLLFGPAAGEAVLHGLGLPNVVLRGVVPDVAGAMRREARVVFVPMTFDPEEGANARLSFPSKLAEYTATGLPLLIHGPPDCSAVRWARERPGVAEVVEREGSAGLAAALQRLARDGGRRVRLGHRALEAGRECFSHETTQKIFLGCLHRAPGDRRETAPGHRDLLPVG